MVAKKKVKKAPRKKADVQKQIKQKRSGGVIQNNKQNVKVTISLAKGDGGGGTGPSLPNITYSYPQYMIQPGTQLADFNNSAISPSVMPKALTESMHVKNPQSPEMQLADPTENTDTLMLAEIRNQKFTVPAMSQPPPSNRILRTSSEDSNPSIITAPFSPPGFTQIYDEDDGSSMGKPQQRKTGKPPPQMWQCPTSSSCKVVANQRPTTNGDKQKYHPKK
jgi:hypothetical protein